MASNTITFTVMDTSGDSPHVRTVDPDDPAVLAEVEAEFQELMAGGRVAFADGEKVHKDGLHTLTGYPEKVPREVLFLAPMVGG